MTKLEELVKQYCPKGIRYISINECIKKIERINWKENNNTFEYIDLTSVDRDTHNITETTLITSKTAPSRAQQIVRENDIIVGTTRPMLKRYCVIPKKYDNQICSTGFCVLRAKNDIVLTRWLYHNITSTSFFSHVEKHQQGASYPAISDKDVKNYVIPLPPLEVQLEIVKILDNFTELTAKLTAELTARQKQYEYYRDMLLSFDVRRRGNNVVEWRTLGEIANNIFSGKNKNKSESGNYPVYGSTGIIGYCDDYEYSNEQILIARVGANAGYVHIAKGNYDVSDNTLIVNIKPSYSLKFVYHVLTNIGLNKYAKGGGQPLVTAGEMKKIKIPIPSLDVQERIVNVLDNFEAICSDLKIGLPAEIDARQKQYEYYRDLLLNFESYSQIVNVERERERECRK